MKRIMHACLEQTNIFETREEYETYLAQLKRKKAVFKIVSETTREDGAVIVAVKKQYLHYDVGQYLD